VSGRDHRPLGVYIHIPFCEVKCTYCHFAIDPRLPPGERQERYLKALLSEMGRGLAPEADTLYLGGGTPSLMSLDRLERLIDAARGHFSLTGAEITLEANPRDLTLESYRRLRELGVNRLSLGVQSFDEGVLREMGRLHSGEDSYQAVAWARSAGFDNISLDFILGWPGETRDRWRRNLRGLADIGPEHVSLYVLEVEGKTALSHDAQRGALKLPEDDLVAAIYWETVRGLDALGIRRYEISNFARAGHESRHNGKYWDDLEFIGLGQAAHSYLGSVRYWNEATFIAYCRRIEEGQDPRAGERVLEDFERIGEALFTGLRRTEGVDLLSFTRRYGVDPVQHFGPDLARCFEAGLVEVSEGRLRLTEKGVLLSNEVFQIFV
jgi:oxygen-independent coproporphyrinogen-3 oxidase